MSTPDIEFLLPGSWRFVPLAEPEATKRVIARITENAIGRADDRAGLRAEMRARFEGVADHARGAGGQQLWLCDEIVPGVPLPASITAYWPALAARRVEDADDADQLAGALHALLGPTPEDVDEADLVSGGRAAVRRALVSKGRVTADPDAQEIETVESDYWIIRPDGRQVLILSFSCGLPLLKDKLVELFDLIVTTLRWPGTTRTAAPEEPPASAAAAAPAAEPSSVPVY